MIPTWPKDRGSTDYKIDRKEKAGRIRVIREGPLLVEAPVRIIDIDGTIIGEGDRFVLLPLRQDQKSTFLRRQSYSREISQRFHLSGKVAKHQPSAKKKPIPT